MKYINIEYFDKLLLTLVIPIRIGTYFAKV